MAIKGGINHIALSVANLQKAEKFYVDVLGLKCVGQRRGMHFYSSGHYNHELALIEDSSFSSAKIQQGGLVHIAFNMEDMKSLKVMYQTLIDAEYPVSSGVDHTISRSFYTRDADGYLIELTTDSATEEWKNDPDAFKKDAPIELVFLNQ